MTQKQSNLIHDKISEIYATAMEAAIIADADPTNIEKQLIAARAIGAKYAAKTIAKILFGES